VFVSWILDLVNLASFAVISSSFFPFCLVSCVLFGFWERQGE